jgi:single-stranded-DNA-specific exonuclease
VERHLKKWRVAPSSPEKPAVFASELGCSTHAAQLLLNRGIQTPEAAHSFLSPSLDDLPDPFLLPDAEKAAERLKQALNKKEKIAVHGDYDGDGVTSAALWTRLLQTLEADVTVHVPHRKRDGYDMRSKFVAQAKADGASLIVTTDCGIQRSKEVEEAREAGIDVIITDHHEPGEELPKAVAVVNPHRKDSKYPFQTLAGVGVAFRTGEALIRHLGMPVDKYRRAYIDLAAIGTITDVMPLVSDNRVFAKFGLEQLGQTRKLGLRALITNARLGARPLTTRDVGFGIGPRLNAIGRMDDSRVALDLLLTRDAGEAAELSSRLEKANSERRTEQDRIFIEAMAEVDHKDFSQIACLVISGTGWNSGVIGIVASKLVERYHRPTVLISLDEATGLGRGSARSIKPFDLFHAISACGEHLIEFGGHSHAAGLSLQTSSLHAFRDAMNLIASTKLSAEDLVPTINADLELPAGQVTLALLNELAMFEPWGCANEEPAIVSRNVSVLDVRRIGKEQNHLKMLVRSDALNPTDCIMWGAGDLAGTLSPGMNLDICYRPQINEFNGRRAVQFLLLDFRDAENAEK